MGRPRSWRSPPISTCLPERHPRVAVRFDSGRHPPSSFCLRAWHVHRWHLGVPPVRLDATRTSCPELRAASAIENASAHVSIIARLFGRPRRKSPSSSARMHTWDFLRRDRLHNPPGGRAGARATTSPRAPKRGRTRPPAPAPNRSRPRPQSRFSAAAPPTPGLAPTSAPASSPASPAPRSRRRPARSPLPRHRSRTSPRGRPAPPAAGSSPSPRSS